MTFILLFIKIRILILLLVLASVSSTLLLQKDIAQDSQGSLDIRIIPVIADQNSKTHDFVQSLSKRDFTDIERYLVTQAKHYKLDLKNSLDIKLGNPIESIPPRVPYSDSSRLSIIWWSLKLRWWA